MAKTIEIDYKGKTYTLAFTRDTVRQMEKDGFDVNAATNGSAPVSVILGLFEGSFKANHPKVHPSFADNMYDDISEKDLLIEALTEMYSETVETLMAEPDAVAAKNATWKKKW